MRRLRVSLPMLVIAAVVALSVVYGSVPSAEAQGLNDVLVRLLSNNCEGLGGTPSSSPPPNATNALFDVCNVPPTFGAASAGGGPTVESRLGVSEEQRRQARRLADIRSGGGGSADQPGSGFGVFVNGDYQFLNKDTTRFETGFEQNTVGTTVGVDYSFRGRGAVGVAFNYAHEFGDFAGASGGFDNDVYGVTLYGTVMPIENMFVDAFVGYTRKDYTFDRSVHVSIAPDRLVGGKIDSATDSDEMHVGATLGYDFILGKFTVGPRVGVNYRDARISGFRERGSTGIELIYDNQNVVSLTSTVGVFASMAISTGFGVLVPQATAEYVHEFENDQRSVGFTFVDLSDRPRYLFQTDRPDRNFFNVGLGVVAVFSRGLSAYVNVRELLGYSDRTATTVTVGVRTQF